MRVELLYRADCPHVAEARAELRAAFGKARVPPRWRERPIDVPSTPEALRLYGSPTILVDGRDVAGESGADGATCRVYRDANGQRLSAPPAAMIAAALRARPPVSGGDGRTSGWRSSLAVVPGIAAALLPKVACPACWPAYAGVLGSLGLGFVLESAWLFALTGAFLAIALGALVFRARRRRGYGPFLVGGLAAATILIGKFYFESDTATYAGVALLVAASLWNSWPRRRAMRACSACEPEASST